METHKFILLSGVPCEIGKLLGKHQRFFTQEEFKKDSKGANMALADIIVKLGSMTSVTAEEVGKMLSQDRKQILIQARIFSLKRNKTFKFDYKYQLDGKQHVDFMELDVEAKDFEVKQYKQQFAEYDEIWKLLKDNKWASTILEDCGLEVFFIPTDGIAESKMQAIPKKKRSSHTLIEIHKPLYMHKKDATKEGVLINVDLDKLSLDDIEDLRTAIKEEEGLQDTKAIFDNPETDMEEEIDVLQIPAFFFPSNAM